MSQSIREMAWSNKVRMTALVLAVLTAVLALVGLPQYSMLFGVLTGSAWCLATLGRDISAKISTEELILSGLFLVVLVAIVIPGTLGWIQATHAVTDQLVEPDTPAWGKILLISFAVMLAAYLMVRNWPNRLNKDWQFLAVMSCLVVIGRTVYVVVVSKDLVSDFNSMWSVAGDLAQNFYIPDENAQALRKIHYTRVLPIFYPLAKLFGTHEQVYEFANVVMTLVTSLMTYWVTKTLYGKTAAQFAFVLSALAVETWMAMSIATHDIPGAMFTMLLLLVLFQCIRTGAQGASRWALGLAGLAGVIGFVTNMQRGTGNLVLISFLVLVSVSLIVLLVRRRNAANHEKTPQKLLMWALIALLPILISKTLDFSASGWNITRSNEEVAERRFVAISAHTESWSGGGYGNWRKHYAGRPMPSEGAKWFAMNRFAADTYHNPIDRIGQFARKATNLFNLGSQTGFYIRGAKFGSHDEIRPFKEETIFVYISKIWLSVFLALFLLGIIKVYSTHRYVGMAHIPMLYLAGFILGLLLLSQIQPRYLFQIWYLGAIYGGAYLAACIGQLEFDDKPMIEIG